MHRDAGGVVASGGARGVLWGKVLMWLKKREDVCWENG